MQLHMFRSGSSGNCSLLVSGRTRLLIDAGMGPRVLAKELALLGLSVRDLTGAIFTHCHSDHLQGPTLALLGREGVPIHLNAGTWETTQRRLDARHLAPLGASAVRLFDADRPFAAGELEIRAFPVVHGHPGPLNPAGDPVGFVMTDGADTFGYCTDIGHVTETVLSALAPADLLVLECNHDVEMVRFSARPYPTKQWITGDAGHLSNVQAADALAALLSDREGVGVILAHLSDQCNTRGLARNTVAEALEGRCDATIGLAERHHATVPWRLEKGRAEALEPLTLF